MNNLLKLNNLDEDTFDDIERDNINFATHKIFASNRYLVCTILDDGSVQIYTGEKLNVADLCFLQKMMNKQVEQMYP